MKFSDASIWTMPILPPRNYQFGAWKAYYNGIRNIIISLPRRNGKDIVSLSIIVQHCITHPNTTAVLLAPNRSWASRIWWNKSQDVTVNDMVTGYERRMVGSMLDIVLPECFRKSTNIADLRIELHNGSVITLENSDSMSFVGSKFNALLVSEMAQHKEEVFPLLSPIIAEAKNPLVIYNGTVTNKEASYFKLIENAQKMKDYHVTYLHAEDTKQVCWVSPDVDGSREYNINPELLNKINPATDSIYQNVQDLVDAGQPPVWLFREFINKPVWTEVGSYYSDQILQARDEGRVHSEIKWDAERPVYTACDLGMGDKTAIVFYQYKESNGAISVIDYYQNNQEPIKHYIDLIRSKPYRYGAHYAPHDVRNTSLQSGVNLMDYCRTEYDFIFAFIPRTKSLIEDINIVRSYMHSISFNGKSCYQLLTSLESYRENPSTLKPKHDSNSHGADAFRYMINTIHLHMLVAHDLFGNMLPDKKLQQAVKNVAQNDNLYLGDDDGNVFATNVDDMEEWL